MLKFLERFRRRPMQSPRVVVEPGGFALIQTDTKQVRVRWSSVNRVLTYKHDRLTTDEIVVVFVHSEDPAHPVEVSEEYTGFADLFGPLERELGVSPEWYLRTSAKPFDTDFQVIYERSSTAARSDLDR